MLGYYEMTRALQVHGAYKAPEGGVDHTNPNYKKVSPFEVTGFIVGAVYWIALIYMSGKDVGFMDTTFPGPALDNPGITPYLHHANLAALVAIMVLFFVNMVIYVFTFPKYQGHQVIGSIFAFVYIPIMISCIYRARFIPAGKFVYALIFFCSWICDTGAWLFGRLFGKHKMAPILTPKKTIEGAVGGVFCGTLLCFGAAILASIYEPGLHVELPFIVIGVCGCFLGMVGDLAASAIKRNFEIKDYGDVIPGHGGIMDRFDSIIFTAPAIFMLGAAFLVGLRV